MEIDFDTLVDEINKYENGEMTEEEIINFFQGLVDSGMAWSLQGHYGRRACLLIEEGFIEPPSDWLVLGNLDYRGCADIKNLKGDQ